MKKPKELYDKIATFLKEVKVEMRKVTWPNRKDLFSYTVVVLITVFILCVIIGIEDFFLQQLLLLFLH